MEQTQGQPGTKPCYKSKHKTLITQVTLCIILVSASVFSLCIPDFAAWHVQEQRKPLHNLEFKHFLCSVYQPDSKFLGERI